MPDHREISLSGEKVEVPETLIASAEALAGTGNGVPADKHNYNYAGYATGDVKLMRIQDLHLDWGQREGAKYKDDKLKNVLVEMLKGEDVYPVEVTDKLQGPITVANGYHRVIASKLLDFEWVPCLGVKRDMATAVEAGDRPLARTSGGWKPRRKLEAQMPPSD